MSHNIKILYGIDFILTLITFLGSVIDIGYARQKNNASRIQPVRGWCSECMVHTGFDTLKKNNA
jgi:hypothetical protein